VHRIEFERRLAQVDDRSVARFLALDADIASQLIGPIASVSAVGAGNSEDSLAGMTVHLIGQQPYEVRWSTAFSSEDSSGSEVRFIGSRGEATLRVDPDSKNWSIASTVESLRGVRYPEWEWGIAVLQSLTDGSGVSWRDACRDLEIAETALVSLRRRRTLDVVADAPTEEDSFKGVMAIGSCFLLVLVLASLCLLAVIEGFRLALIEPSESPEPSRWPLLWRLWPVYPLLFFLSLQLLLLVAKRRKREARSASESVETR
jgi:hypothetical protein